MVGIESVFKAMGDPTRIQILRMLAENGEMCVCKITDQLSMTQSSVSHHLSALKNADLVTARRKGQWSYYALCSGTLSDTVIAFASELLERLHSVALESDKNLQEEVSQCCE